MARVGAAHDALADPDAWLDGHGWDPDRWGRWPTADDLERVAPGRRVMLWAHDHHALLASFAALRTAGVTAETPDPPGGVIRRAADGSPEGVLYETAARLVSIHLPAPDQADLEAAIATVGAELVSLGLVACHDPGALAPDPDLSFSFPAYAHLAETGRLPVRVHASLRDDALETAIAGGLRSGGRSARTPTAGPGSAGRSASPMGPWAREPRRCSRISRSEPDQPLPPERRRGLWITPPDELARLTRAAAAGIATQIHAIGDAAVRAALDVLIPTAAGVPLMPRLEHVQLVHPADLGRFASGGVAASVQPVHVGSDAVMARRLWGDRAESNGYPWASIARTGAVLAFGTDAPVEPFDPWPGIALAVRREDRDGRPARRRSGRPRRCRWIAPSGPPVWTRHCPRARRTAGGSSRVSAPTSSSSRRGCSMSRWSRAGRWRRRARRWS